MHLYTPSAHHSISPASDLYAIQYAEYSLQKSSSQPEAGAADTSALAKPSNKFGECGFRFAGPATWNNLPDYYVISLTAVSSNITSKPNQKLNYAREYTASNFSFCQSSWMPYKWFYYTVLHRGHYLVGTAVPPFPSSPENIGKCNYRRKGSRYYFHN